ncbi:hypothetical protein FRC03_009887 [Tulasnella sp. 419]|nr:hypothetical protein FRC03_009887 [Tulasnella sp. 419]
MKEKDQESFTPNSQDGIGEEPPSASKLHGSPVKTTEETTEELKSERLPISKRISQTVEPLRPEAFAPSGTLVNVVVGAGDDTSPGTPIPPESQREAIGKTAAPDPTSFAESSSASEPLPSTTSSAGTQTEEEDARSIQNLKAELANSQAEVDRLKKMLYFEQQERRRRDEEVACLQEYGIAYDEAHESDVFELVKKINDMAATFSDSLSLKWDLSKGKAPINEPERLSGLELVLARCPPEHPLARRLLQFGFRSCILDIVSQIVGVPCYGILETGGDFLNYLEPRIRCTAIQPTYARWRAITYNILFSDYSNTQNQRIPEISRNMTWGIRRMGELLTGHGLQGDGHETLEINADKKMQKIITKSLQLARMIRTQVLSANYMHCRPTGQKYDRARMSVPQHLTEPLEDDTVVATIGLGLLRHEIVVREGMGMTEEKLDVVMEAQVLTEGEIAAILNIESPPKSLERDFSDSSTQSSSKKHNLIRSGWNATIGLLGLSKADDTTM